MKYKMRACYFSVIVLFLFAQCIPAFASRFKIPESLSSLADDLLPLTEDLLYSTESLSFLAEELETLANPIDDYCHFNKDIPVELILDGDTLKRRLSDRTETLRQYLLIDDVTLVLNRTLQVHQSFTLCGIRHWLLPGNTRDSDGNDVSSGSGMLFEPLLPNEESSPGKRLLPLINRRAGDPRAMIIINQLKKSRIYYRLQLNGNHVEFNHLGLVRPPSSKSGESLLYISDSRATLRDILIDDLAKFKPLGNAVEVQSSSVYFEQIEINSSPASYHYSILRFFNNQVVVNGMTVTIRGRDRDKAIRLLTYSGNGELPCTHFQNVSINGAVPGVDNTGFEVICLYDEGKGKPRIPIFFDQVTFQGSISTGIIPKPPVKNRASVRGLEQGFCSFQTGEHGLLMNSDHREAQYCHSHNRTHIGDIRFNDGHVCTGITAEEAGYPDSPKASCAITETSLTEHHLTTSPTQSATSIFVVPTPATTSEAFVPTPATTSEAFAPAVDERSDVAAIMNNVYAMFAASLIAMLSIYYW